MFFMDLIVSAINVIRASGVNQFAYYLPITLVHIVLKAVDGICAGKDCSNTSFFYLHYLEHQITFMISAFQVAQK